MRRGRASKGLRCAAWRPQRPWRSRRRVLFSEVVSRAHASESAQSCAHRVGKLDIPLSRSSSVRKARLVCKAAAKALPPRGLMPLPQRSRASSLRARPLLSAAASASAPASPMPLRLSHRLCSTRFSTTASAMFLAPSGPRWFSFKYSFCKTVFVATARAMAAAPRGPRLLLHKSSNFRLLSEPRDFASASAPSSPILSPNNNNSSQPPSRKEPSLCLTSPRWQRRCAYARGVADSSSTTSNSMRRGALEGRRAGRRIVRRAWSQSTYYS